MLLLLVPVLIAAGCSMRGRSKADLDAARKFHAFPLYWVGEQFERWSLTTTEGLDGTTEFVTLIYGTCAPHDGDEPSCVPPLEIQISALCRHLKVVARAPIWKRRHIRGAPVGTIDSAPVLFTHAAQIKVYRGEGSDAGLPLRVLRALRSLNRVPPVIGPSGVIPAPAPGVLQGTRPCTT
jgi:hypothetical protein